MGLASLDQSSTKPGETSQNFSNLLSYDFCKVKKEKKGKKNKFLQSYFYIGFLQLTVSGFNHLQQVQIRARRSVHQVRRQGKPRLRFDEVSGIAARQPWLRFEQDLRELGERDELRLRPRRRRI